MATAATTLHVIAKNLLPEKTLFYGTEDGTAFYYDFFLDRLKVIRGGEAIAMRKLDGCIYYAGVHENAIYFEWSGMVYKAVFAYRIIIVSYVRSLIEDERLHDNTNSQVPLCSRMIGDETFVYRLCEDPERDGILVYLSQEEKGMIKCIHRGSVYLFSHSPQPTPSVRKLRTNVFVVEASACPDYVAMYAIDDSTFIYLSHYDKYILTFDVTTMEFLPPLQFEGFTAITNVTVARNGNIAATGYVDGYEYVVTAQLPIGYFGRTPYIAARSVRPYYEYRMRNNERCDGALFKLQMKDMLDEIKAWKNEGYFNRKDLIPSNEELKVQLSRNMDEMSALERRMTSEKEEIVLSFKKMEKEMVDTIDGLQNQISDLMHEKDQIQKINEEMEISTTEQFEENKELKRRIDFIMKENTDIKRREMQLKARIDEQNETIQIREKGIDTLSDALAKSSENQKEALNKIKNLIAENEQLKLQNAKMT